ncbi:MAG: SIR2 family protein, partial [Shewanella sp.]|uniref:SIR2 family protein n=1 Tax=Shewanella sp. TaxID=50422 RepID=UPI003F34F835
RGLEIMQDSKADALRKELEEGMKSFALSILQSESGIATAEEAKREQAFNTLVTFMMSFASRTGVRDRLNIFTTNYDRLIEAGAELAGLHLLDRFLGNLMPIFRSSRLDLDMHYNPPGIRGEPRYLEGVARFTKLHGSVDWVQTGKDIRRIGLPFGAKNVTPYIQAPGLGGVNANKLMIYPNAAKDRETADYPYVELFRDLAAAVCRPNSTLVTYGYSFGDEHINRVIRDMLTIPSTHLVVISYDDQLGRIMKTYEEMGRPSQISLLIGPALADLATLTENYLPKAAIDKTTFRMSELLKQRWGTVQADDATKPLAVSGDVATDLAVTGAIA